MNRHSSTQTSRLCLEFGQGWFRALWNGDGLEVRLERLPNGRLGSGSREDLTEQLRRFLQRPGTPKAQRALCAISSRGVSTRRLALPAAPIDDLEKVVRLQIEREFPLPPEELAWGFWVLPAAGADEKAAEFSANSANAATHVMVYAVKKEIVHDYAELLERCGIKATFTLNAVALAALGPAGASAHAVLELGLESSELVCCTQGVPTVIRILDWGINTLGARPDGQPSDDTRAGDKGAPELFNTPMEVERILEASPPTTPTPAGFLAATTHAAVLALARLLPPHLAGQKLYLTGPVPTLAAFALDLGRALGNGEICEEVPIRHGTGRSAVTLGLMSLGTAAGSGTPPMRLNIPEPTARARKPAPAAPWTWAALAAVLAVAAVVLRYTEAAFQTSRLTRHLNALKTYQQRLPQMERELAFLQHLRINQPPYLDSIALLAGAAPSGFRLDSLSLNRRGDVSLKASLRDAQQLVEFRSKLVQSGRFASVVVDEQTPSADQQKLTVRMTAQWRPSLDPGSPSPGSAPATPASRERDPPPTAGPWRSTPAAGNDVILSASTNTPAAPLRAERKE